jgi:hypothetical protein
MTSHHEHGQQDELLEEVGALLRVEPSEHFTEQVRRSVTASHTTRVSWLALAAAAVLTTGVTVTWMFNASVPAGSEDARPIAKASAAPSPSVATAPAPAPAVIPVAVTRDIEIHASTSSTYEVITNQPSLLASLWADVPRGVRIQVEAAVVTETLGTIVPVAIEPIVVTPLSEVRRAEAAKESR